MNLTSPLRYKPKSYRRPAMQKTIDVVGRDGELRKKVVNVISFADLHSAKRRRTQDMTRG